MYPPHLGSVCIVILSVPPSLQQLVTARPGRLIRLMHSAFQKTQSVPLTQIKADCNLSTRKSLLHQYPMQNYQWFLFTCTAVLLHWELNNLHLWQFCIVWITWFVCNHSDKQCEVISTLIEIQRGQVHSLSSDPSRHCRLYDQSNATVFSFVSPFLFH